MKKKNIIREYKENFMDEVGNKAVLTKCDYIDNKGKKVVDHIKLVSWIEEEKEIANKNEKEDFLKHFYIRLSNYYYISYDSLYIIHFFEYKDKIFCSYNLDFQNGEIKTAIFELKDESFCRFEEDVLENKESDNLTMTNPPRETFEENMDYIIENSNKIYFLKEVNGKCNVFKNNAAISRINMFLENKIPLIGFEDL